MMLRRYFRPIVSPGIALAMAAAVASLTGCVSQQILPYEASIANEAKLGSLPREARLQVKTLDSDPSNVTTVVRTLRVTAPGNGSWSAYLGQALHTELAASGHYDANAALVLDASLTELKIADGAGAITAHFVIRAAQGARYDKVLHVDTRWDSDFFGVIAASNGMNQATAIFQALLQKLFDDPDFVKAVRSA